MEESYDDMVDGALNDVLLLATLLSPAHAAAAATYVQQALDGGQKPESIITPMLAGIVTEMINGPIRAASLLGAATIIAVVEQDSPEIGDRNNLFRDVTMVDGRFIH